MAIVFADSFDSYGATADLTQNWFTNSNFTWNATAGRLGAGAVQTVTSAGALRSPMVLAAGSALIYFGFCFWLKASTTPSAFLNLINVLSSIGVYTGSVCINTSGLMCMSGNGTSAFSGITGATNVCDNQWHWISCNYVSNGTNYVYVDGTLQVLTSGSLNNTAPSYAVLQTPAQGTWTFDDVFFYDFNTPAPTATSSGGAVTPRYMTTIRPSADSAVTFSRSSGSTNFSLVNETAADGDTSYVQNATVGQADEYDFTDLSFTPATILTVMQTTRAENPGAGTVSLKNRCHSGATTSDSTAFTVSSNYNNTSTFYHTDPNTAGVWSATNLNSAKFGYVVA